MNKLKKVFSPGHQKDDEVMYGTPSKASRGVDPTAKDTASPKASTAVSSEPPRLESSHGTDKNEDSMLTQVLSGGSEKNTESNYQTTSKAAPTSQTEETPRPLPGTAVSRLLREEHDDASCWSIKSGVVGPYAGRPADDPHLVGAEESHTTTSEARTEPTTATENPAEESNTGRDTAIAGAGVGAAGVAAAGAAAYESEEPKTEETKSEEPKDDIAGATYTARSYPLPDRTTTVEPSSTTAEDQNATDESHLGRDAAIAGAGAGVLGAGGVAAYEMNKSTDDPETASPEAVTSDPAQLDSASRLGPHVPGEFPAEDGSDPHMPGAYPITPQTEVSEEDREIGSSGVPAGGAVAAAVAAVAGGAGIAGYEASKSSKDQPSSTNESSLHPGGKGYPVDSSTSAGPATTAAAAAWSSEPKQEEAPKEEEKEEDNNYARDAAVAATAAAAGGAGVYAATTSDEEESTSSPPSHGGFFGRPPASSSLSPEERADVEKEKENHYGRDAAIAGGAIGMAGIAGAGTYTAMNRSDEPQKSDIVDSRAKESTPKKTEDKTEEKSTTQKIKERLSGKSSSMEKEEKSMENEKNEKPLEKEEDDSNLGRDAAIVGGGTAAAGAAGVGAYEMSKDKDDEPPSSPSTSRFSHEGSPSNKTAVDDRGHTHLHKKSSDQPAEKRRSFLSKVLHRDKSKRESQSPRSSSDKGKSPEGRPTSGVSTGSGSGSPQGKEQQYITLVHEGAPPDAPHMIVREGPDGRIEAVDRDAV